MKVLAEDHAAAPLIVVDLGSHAVEVSVPVDVAVTGAGVLAYPRSDTRRAELIAELYAVPRMKRG